MNNKISSNTTERAEALEQYIKQLDLFIKNTLINLTNMKNKHQQMGTLWRGKEYDDFSTIMMQTIKDAAKELAELENLKKELEKEAVILRLGEEKLKQLGKQ